MSAPSPTRWLVATNWPLRDDPVHAIATLVACCAIGAVAGWLSGSVSMGLLAALAVALAMWQLWIPITTELGPRGVTLTMLGRRRRILWRDIEHLDLLGQGVFLSAHSARVEASVWGHFFLPWGRGREAIAAFCRQYHGSSPAEWSGQQRRGIALGGPTHLG